MNVTVNYDHVPEELKKLSQWVCTNEGNKIPMKSYENEAASSIDPGTWSDFETAKESYERGYYDYCGFVFADNGYVGIDIDAGFDDYGLPSALMADVVGRCRSYTEVSKSGKGFHIILRGTLPFSGRNNLAGLEIYKTSRYFIMTGHTILFDQIVENQDAIDYIVERYFPSLRNTTHESTATINRIYRPVWENPVCNGRIQLRPTYPRIPDGCRNTCLTSLAGALHNIGYTRLQTYNELCHVNAIACIPQLDKNEIRTICNSIAKYKR